MFSGRGASWAQPVALDEVLAHVEGGNARIMAGNTDLGYADRYRPKENRKTVFLHRVAEMHQIEWADEAVRIGAGVTIEQLAWELERRLPSLDETRTSCLKALMSQCRFLGNHQIRSVATVGGGIVNFNHYSDLIPIWVVSGAQLVFRSSNGEEIKELLQSYGPGGDLDFDPRAHGILTSITVPFSGPDERVSNFKYSRRRLDSITFMSAGVRFAVAEDHSLADVVLCLDGLGPPGLRAVKTEAFLKGKVWESDVLAESLHLLHDELSPRITNGLPPRLQNHQLRLAQAALLRVNQQYQREFLGRSGDREGTLVSRYPDIAHRAHAVFEEHSNGAVGRAIPHRDAKNQTTGDALYSNDREEANRLYASLVTSPVACGRLRSIDAGAALKHPDVVAFLSAKDIPGKNLFGFRVEDEEVLASERVHFVGQAVGVLVAQSAQVAREQAWAVSVEVAEEEPILSIDRAIEEKSEHGRADGYLLE